MSVELQKDIKNRIEWNPKSAGKNELKEAAILIQSFVLDDTTRRSHDKLYYYWKFINNPYGLGKMWIVYDNDIVVGMAAFTPKNIKIAFHNPMTAEIGDTFTHPKYQRKGIFSILVNSVRDDAIRNSGIEFIYGTPNTNSLPGYEKKLNFAQIPSANVYNYILPIQIDKILKSKYGNSLAIKFLSICTRVFYDLRYNQWKSVNSSDVTIVNKISSEMSTLWEQVAENLDVITVRDKKYLKWRFVSNVDKYIIWHIRKNEKLIGYTITKSGLWNGLKVLYIADYLILPNHQKCAKKIICAIIKYANDKGYDMISCWSVKNNDFTKILSKLGFLRDKSIPIICYANDLGKKVIESNYKWHFTMADSDNI